MVGCKQGIDRFDQFGGITLNAGQFLREKAAVDEKLQFCAVRVVDATKRDRCEHRKKQPEGTELSRHRSLDRADRSALPGNTC